MGYRQQFFVAAKVNDKYRMLAIVHHQWIYGRTSLRQCLSILKVLSAPGNLPGIRRELAQAAASESNPSLLPGTYPFIATSLIIGSSYHEEGHYTANVKPQQLDTAWDTFPNDDGIIVFDITNPSTPRYGYIWLDAPMPHAQYARRLPFKTVMPASKYISGYYNISDFAQNNMTNLISEFEGFPLIDASMLNEIWTNGNFKSMAHSAAVPDLHDLSLEDLESHVVDRYLRCEQDELPTPEELRLHSERIMNRFAAKPSLLLDQQGWTLFKSFVGTVSEVDLTPFVDIEVEKIMAIIKAAASAPQPQKALTIWLPSSNVLTIEHLKSIVGNKTVSGLHLGRTKQIKLKQKLMGLFEGTDLVKLTSPLLFSRAIQMTFGPNQKLVQAQLRVTEDFPNGLGSKFPIRQIVYLTSVTKANPKRLESGGLCWKQRTAKSHFVPMYVKDALLSTHDMVESAPAALGRLATTQEWQLESQPVAKVVLGIAKMLSVDATHRVKPLPGVMYSMASNAHYDSRKPMLGMMPLDTGGWTLLALHERPSTRQGIAAIRYAFVSADSPEQYNVLDIKTFLSLFAEGEELDTLEARWQEALVHLHHSMTTLEKAPETESSLPPQLAASKGLTGDSMDPSTCGDVEFGVADHEEVVEALQALNVLKEKPINESLGGATCQQN